MSTEIFWEQRYKNNGNSGAGSYGELCNFKTSIINSFIKDTNTNRIIDFGCGDGNQLKGLKIPSYLGVDISETAINKCKLLFSNDKTKKFVKYSEMNFDMGKYDVSMSLDVIYHILEYNFYEKYLSNLFTSTKEFVVIYSSDFDKKPSGHVHHRKFTDYVQKHFTEFKMIKHIPQIHPNISCADFFIYQKQNN